ncbi:MAG TPA: NAD(P)/FAD-dependent oxidoreductase [Solirubrobacteraceae bacterium]|nr:NAD(P)/FAD-dependent oxidoreductase [Solirubrobacteraceae bacterium]
MSYDVVIIGGGHNGLVAGCLLARTGLKTIVVEKEQRLGGMALSAPLIDAAPGHTVSPCAFEDLFFRIGGVVEELELARFGFREYESVGWAWLSKDGDSLLIQRDIEATVRDIARFSGPDAQRYRELMEVTLRCVDIFYGYLTSHPTRLDKRQVVSWLRKLITDRKLRAALGDMLSGSAVDTIAGTFESEAVRSIFANTILGSPFADGNGFTLMNTTLLHRTGIGRPVGGMGGIVAALERCLHSHGGETRTGTAVEHIETVGQRATGVLLADGTQLDARRAVIAACPPQAVPALVGEAFDPRLADRLHSAPDDAWGIGQLTVTLALGEQVELPLHRARRTDVDLRQPTLMTGTLDSIVRAAEESMLGIVPTELPYWATIFNAIDPSQAPDGQDVIDLYSPMVPGHPHGGWAEHRAAAADRLVAGATPFLSPRLPAYELGRFIETPADRAERVGTRNGCIYHIDFLPTRVGPLRPALGLGTYRTPITALYLSGVGTHPPAGVSGLNGTRTAETVLQDLATVVPSRRPALPGRHVREVVAAKTMSLLAGGH